MSTLRFGSFQGSLRHSVDEHARDGWHSPLQSGSQTPPTTRAIVSAPGSAFADRHKSHRMEGACPQRCERLAELVAPYAVDEKQSQPRSKSRSRNNPTGRNPALRDASAGGGTQRRAHVNVRMRDSRTDPQVSVGTMLTLRRVGARATAHTVATCHLCKTSRGPLTLPPSDRPRWSARRSTPRTTSVSTAGAVPALLHP